MSSVFRLAAALRGGFCVYAASLAVITALIGFGSATLFKHGVVVGSQFLLVEQAPRPASPKGHARASVVQDVRGHVTLTQDWLDRIRSDDFWSGRGGARGGGGPSQPNSSRSYLFGPSRPEAPSRVRHDDVPINPKRTEIGYRTVCVRQCDGYFWPISFATSKAHFQRDRAVCESSCGGTAKLYVSSNRNGDLDDMRDLDGQSYTKLPTAFQFRTKYEPACKCNPHPWEQEAKEKHRLLALLEESHKTTRQVAHAKAQPNARRLNEARGHDAAAAAKPQAAKPAKAAAIPAVDPVRSENAQESASVAGRVLDAPSPAKFLIINAALQPKPYVLSGRSTSRGDRPGDRGGDAARR